MFLKAKAMCAQKKQDVISYPLGWLDSSLLTKGANYG